MASMAVVCLTGHLTKDAEAITTSTGKQVLKFSVAVNTGWGDKKNTTFYNCALWQASDKLLQLMLKGQLIGVTGEPSLREYSTDSGKRQSLDVRVNNVILLGSKPQGEAAGDDDGPVPF